MAQAIWHSKSNPDSEPATSFKDAYGRTLKVHHSFSVKNQYSSAMSALPTREVIRAKMGPDSAQQRLDSWLAALKKRVEDLQMFLDTKDAQWKDTKPKGLRAKRAAKRAAKEAANAVEAPIEPLSEQAMNEVEPIVAPEEPKREATPEPEAASETQQPHSVPAPTEEDTCSLDVPSSPSLRPTEDVETCSLDDPIAPVSEVEEAEEACSLDDKENVSDNIEEFDDCTMDEVLTMKPDRRQEKDTPEKEICTMDEPANTVTKPTDKRKSHFLEDCSD